MPYFSYGYNQKKYPSFCDVEQLIKPMVAGFAILWQRPERAAKAANFTLIPSEAAVSDKKDEDKINEPRDYDGYFWHLIGAASAACFYAPFKKVKHWSWETMWSVGIVSG